MEAEQCPLCGRDLIPGPSVNKHHLVPKSHKGKETVLLHRVCHRKIHSLFSDKELANELNTIESLLEKEDIQNFVRWVRKKPPEFYDGTKTAKSKRK